MSAYHTISTSPIIDPPFFSISVAVDEVDLWEEDWLEGHESHAFEGEEWEPGDEEHGYPGKLRAFCGEHRPKGPPPLLVAASTRPYVTVHDFVTAVHPWISDLEYDVRRALGFNAREPVPRHIELFIHFIVPTPLMIIAPYRHEDPAEFFEKEWRRRAGVARRTRDGLL